MYLQLCVHPYWHGELESVIIGCKFLLRIGAVHTHFELIPGFHHFRKRRFQEHLEVRKSVLGQRVTEVTAKRVVVGLWRCWTLNKELLFCIVHTLYVDIVDTHGHSHCKCRLKRIFTLILYNDIQFQAVTRAKEISIDASETEYKLLLTQIHSVLVK